MIESVKEASSKFKSESLGQFKGSLQGYVPGIQPRCHENVARAVAVGTRKRVREGIYRCVGLREICELIVNGANAVISLVEVAHAAFIAEGEHWRSEAITKCGGSGKLPILGNIGQFRIGFWRGNSVHIGDQQRAPLIKLRVPITTPHIR